MNPARPIDHGHVSRQLTNPVHVAELLQRVTKLARDAYKSLDVWGLTSGDLRRKSKLRTVGCSWRSHGSIGSLVSLSRALKYDIVCLNLFWTCMTLLGVKKKANEIRFSLFFR